MNSSNDKVKVTVNKDGSRNVTISSVKPRRPTAEEIIEAEISAQTTVISNEPMDTSVPVVVTSNNPMMASNEPMDTSVSIDSFETSNEPVTNSNNEIMDTSNDPSNENISAPNEYFDTAPFNATYEVEETVIVTKNTKDTGESQPSENGEDNEDGPYYTRSEAESDDCCP